MVSMVLDRLMRPQITRLCLTDMAVIIVYTIVLFIEVCHVICIMVMRLMHAIDCLGSMIIWDPTNTVEHSVGQTQSREVKH